MLTEGDFYAALKAQGENQEKTHKEKYEALIALRDRIDPDITAQARQVFREDLRGEFEDFLNYASYADLLFLRNVFETCHGNFGLASVELSIASAFAIELRRDEAYFKVPEELRGEVAQLLEARCSKRLVEFPQPEKPGA